MKHKTRDGLGRFAKAKDTFKTIAIWGILIAIAGTVCYHLLHNYLVDEFIHEASAVTFIAPKEVEDNRDNKQKAIDYLKEKGFTDEMLFKFTCLMHRENGKYDPYAYYVNTDGSVDRGFLMHNSKQPPYKISNECSFNMYCSLDKFATYILAGGDWNRWLGYKNYCK